MSENENNNLQAVIEAAREGCEPHEIDAVSTYAVPDGSGGVKLAVSPSLEKYQPAPERKRGIYWPQTVDSFIDYVEAHKGDGTTIWIEPNRGHIEAVLNDHTADGTGWGDHRAVLDLIESPEWAFWMKNDGEMLAQIAFANHIEEGLADLLEPDGAEMLEIAQRIEGTNSVAFKSKIDLTSGEVRVGYDEKVEANAEGASGQLVIPKTFAIGVAPFVGEPTFRLVARLRYRINGGNLALGYKIDRPDAAVREVLKGIHATVSEKFDGIVYFGSTPSGERVADGR